MALNSDQQLAKDLIDRGENTFISGSGGYGKSHLINVVKTPNTIIGCPTGAAAIIVGGSTNHRTFAAPVGVIKGDEYVKRLKKEHKEVLGNADRIILDEGSMIRLDMFNYINNSLQHVTGNKEPFGSKQVIMVGDFYQLGAFVSDNERMAYRSLYGSCILPFESEYWNFKTVELTQPMRNTNLDQIEVLQDIRKGNNVKQALDRIVYNSVQYSDKLDWTHLCATNRDVDARNKKCYSQLKTKEQVFKGKVTGSREAINKELRVPIDLKLKLDMRVMITYNCKEGTYVNGSTGAIVELGIDYITVLLDNGNTVFVGREIFPVMQYTCDGGVIRKKQVASLTQFPIISGWACSIHKAQGSTLEKCVINLGKYSFADHLFYVAVSRVKDMRNLSFVRTPTVSDVRVNQKVKKFYGH